MKTQLLATGLLTIVTLSASAQAAPIYDANVTPDILFGAGNANGSFTVDRDNGVEVGLRGKLRYDSAGQPQNIFNSNGDGSYTFDAGVAPTQSYPTAIWSFEWSINTDWDNSSGYNLDNLTYALTIDQDPGPGVNLLTFDPINDPNPDTSTVLWDHAIGDNSTGNGGGTSATTTSQYASLLANNNVAQNSWKAHWFIGGFDPNAKGVYTISLSAFNGASTLASTSIDINVVPEPSTLALGGLGLAVLGYVGVRRWRRRRN